MLQRLLTPSVMIALGSIAISFCALFVTLTTTGPTIDGFYRMLFGGILLVIIGIIRRETFWTTWQALGLAALAGILFGADLSFWHLSIYQIGPGLATVIVNLQVIPLAILGIFVYKDRVDNRFYIAIPVSLFGLYILVGHGWTQYSDNYRLGIWQCFLAMSAYSCYTLSLRKSRMISNNLSPIPSLAITSLTSALFLGLVAMYRGESFIIPNSQDWMWLLLYSIFGQVIGWLLISKGIAGTTISRAGLLLLLQPGFSLMWDTLLLGRNTMWWEYLGTTIALAAIYFGTTSRQEQETD